MIKPQFSVNTVPTDNIHYLSIEIPQSKKILNVASLISAQDVSLEPQYQ